MVDYKATYQGLTMELDTDFEIVSIEGLMARDVEITTPDLPRYHGGLVGSSYHAPRPLILTVNVFGAPLSAALTANRRTLLKAFQPQVDTESPFVLTLPGETAKRIDCRPLRAASLLDADSELGVAQFLIELIASDPAIYEDSLSSDSLSPFAPSAGLSYPVTYPKAYGAGGSGAGTVVVNAGDWETWPTLKISGPTSGTLTDPIIENVTTGKKVELNANGGVSITVGQQLIIETHPALRSIKFSTGASRYGKLSDASEFWLLEPGNNELRFRASGTTTGATCGVEHRSAWI